MSKVVLKVGDDISTDIIYPGRYMATVLPTETPNHVFADIAEFNVKAQRREFAPNSIILGGDNFGCGSSREQAASCLKGHEFMVVARHFARIFLQNCINLGVNVVICPTVEAEEGDEMELEGTTLINQTSGKKFEITPLPASRQAVIDAGGLVPFTRKRLLESVK